MNGFRSRLQIKLIPEKHLDLTMGAKSLLNYHIQVLCDKSPLQTGKIKKYKNLHQTGTAAVEDQPGTNSKRVGVSTADLN